MTSAIGMTHGLLASSDQARHGRDNLCKIAMSGTVPGVRIFNLWLFISFAQRHSPRSSSGYAKLTAAEGLVSARP